MQSIPRAARLYVSIVLFLGGLIAFLSFVQIVGNLEELVHFLLLAVVITLLDLYPVKFPVARAPNSVVEVTISTAVKIAAVLLFSAPVVLLSTCLGTLIADLRMRREWFKAGFNAGAMAVNYLVVIWIYYVLRQPGDILGSVQNVTALTVLGLSDFAINSILVSLVIALATRLPIAYVWAANMRPNLLHELSMVPIGIAIALLYVRVPWSLVLAVVPLLVVRYSYKAVIDLREQTRQALHALSQVLDERDEATSHHSERVSEFVSQIAREMGLSPTDFDMIVQAAWLHDIGKVGMQNDILYKTGPLTPQEREQAKRHAAIGGRLLEKFPLFQKGAVIVRHHHEWWNGEGYPDGLKGNAIPLGSRILAVADAFEAMTAARPYRDAMPEEKALAELRRCAGVQFDPMVVQAFLKAKVRLATEPQKAMPATEPPKAKPTDEAAPAAAHAVEKDGASAIA